MRYTTILLTPVLLAAFATASAYATAPHSVEIAIGANRFVELSGSFTFALERPIYIGAVFVKPGTPVTVHVEHMTRGLINIKDWRLRSLDLYNATVYVNDRLVITDGHFSLKVRPPAKLARFESSLVLYLSPKPPGKLRLVIDGRTVIDRNSGDDSEVVVRSVALSGDGGLRLSLGRRRHYLSGGAEEVLINGRQVSAVTLGGLSLFLAAAGAGSTYWFGRRR